MNYAKIDKAYEDASLAGKILLLFVGTFTLGGILLLLLLFWLLDVVFFIVQAPAVALWLYALLCGRALFKFSLQARCSKLWDSWISTIIWSEDEESFLEWQARAFRVVVGTGIIIVSYIYF